MVEPHGHAAAFGLDMRTLLFQLRALVNAGFRAVMVISGQNGAQGDLRLVAGEFTRIVPVPVVVRSDLTRVDRVGELADQGRPRPGRPAVPVLRRRRARLDGSPGPASASSTPAAASAGR